VTIGLLTAIYDDYDELKPYPSQNVDVEAVCVTDNRSLACDGWRIVYDPSDEQHPNLAAKRPKMLPWYYLDSDVDASVWIDAAFLVVSETFVDEAVAYADPIAQFRHPWRDCIYTETAASIPLPKYAGLPLSQQAQHYRDEHRHPKQWGLWATGCIARRHTEEVRAFGEAWLDECERWTYQDQISEAVVLRRFGLRPASLPGDHLANPWLVHQASPRHR